jgi:hypothetical protein
VLRQVQLRLAAKALAEQVPRVRHAAAAAVAAASQPGREPSPLRRPTRLHETCATCRPLAAHIGFHE